MMHGTTNIKFSAACFSLQKLMKN